MFLSIYFVNTQVERFTVHGSRFRGLRFTPARRMAGGVQGFRVSR